MPNDVKRDANLFVNTSLVKLGYQYSTITSGHMAPVNNYTTPSSVCDNIYRARVLLGWELHVSYITVPCVQVLSPLFSMPSLYSLFTCIDNEL